jgi:LacI family transcriptional regulator
MSVTIYEIAERAGVSSSTVARILRGDVKGVQKRSADKAAEILRLSKELGYQRDWRARALSRGKTRTIGLLYSNPMWIFEDPMNEIAVSFTESLQRQQYNLMLIPTTCQEHWRELVFGGAVDGLALLLQAPEGIEDALGKSGLPVLVLGDKFPHNVPYVVPDDVAGAYSATRHLLALGHERLVYFVCDSVRDHVSVGEREQGYLQAIAEAGPHVRGEVWKFSNEEAVDRLLDRQRPTAMLAYCQIEALAIAHAAWAHGLSIPQELSLVAFNDILVTKYMTPPLTVVKYDWEEMGRRGAEMLLKRIESPAASHGAITESHEENIVLPPRLIVRGTTAPPPRKQNSPFL